MIRLSKLADYGIVLLTYIADAPRGESRTARQLAVESGLPLPTVSKILKALSRAGLLVAQRGVKGGYSLVNPPSTITVAAMIGAIDGPLGLTECSSAAPSLCEMEQRCPVRSNWQRINAAVRSALDDLTLEDMTRPKNDCQNAGGRDGPFANVVSLVRR